jgi:hypothetical protein
LGLPAARLTRLDGGMSSRTWRVDDGGRRWVLKAVRPELSDLLDGGLAVAARLDQAAIAAGAPEPTRAGALTVTLGRWRLGLLRWVPRPWNSSTGSTAPWSTSRCALGCGPPSARPCETSTTPATAPGQPGCCTPTPRPRRSGSTR